VHRHRADDKTAMKHGIIITSGDPRTAADLAADAEASGWDGVFTWDGISVGDMDTYDPWVVMAAMAMRTSRVRLGAMLTPPSRRRPWKLAKEAMTVDVLSDGRLVMPMGLGALDDAGFGNVGEPTGARERAERLDETLAILEGLWSGAPFAFEGRHYRFGPMTFRPTPVQRPRVPIWVVGAWPSERSMSRVLRCDGLLCYTPGRELTPEAVGEMREWIGERRSLEGFDIVVEGTTPTANAGRAAAEVARWREAGATWWIESDWESMNVDGLRRRIEAGPPRA
jgi:alkanesulfonate monooxygenase SsuD/methylene tetrahydromethanopterin reductase-like flavin-dependent oxidoreductase (luciferase family)